MASRGDINLEEIQPILKSDWLKIKIDQTFEKSGKFTKLKSKDYFDVGNFPVVDQGDKFISGYVNDEKLLYNGELPVIIFGDHTRNIKYVDFQFAVGADGTKILKSNKFYNPKFYFYYLKSLKVPNLGYSRHFSILKKIEFPLPLLPEQNRIVDKLDIIFKHLEIIQTSMVNIPLLIKDFRKQVLTQAVSGKLTQDWRNVRNLELWEELTLSELIVEKPRNGYSPRAVDYETSLKSLSLSATTSGNFDPSHVKYLDIEAPDKNSHLWLMNGDILIQRSNSLEYVGTSAIYDGEDFDFIYPDIMIKIKANDRIITKYLNYCLSSFGTREYFRNNATGTAGNMPKINQVVVLNTPVSLPTHQEQQEIILRVESLFAKVDDIEQQYKSLKEKIDTLPQALLHKAFKGELTEQLESDGDASELLEKIKRLKNSSSAPLKKNIKEKSTEKEQKNDSKKYLVNNIKKILKEKTTGISYKELITKLYDSNEEDLINDIIQQLLITNIISQEFNTEQKQMLIKINQ